MEFLCVQLRGVPNAIQVPAHSAEQNDDVGELLAKDSNGKIIGRFKMSEILGWWTR
jgi:hypothetical protein